MEIEINQGIPQHAYFTICKPKVRYDAPLEPGKTIVKMTNPKTGEKYEAVYYGHWPLKEEEFDSSNGFAMLAYGCSANFLKPKLRELYPELRTEFNVEYWLLKKSN